MDAVVRIWGVKSVFGKGCWAGTLNQFCKVNPKLFFHMSTVSKFVNSSCLSGAWVD